MGLVFWRHLRLVDSLSTAASRGGLHLRQLWPKSRHFLTYQGAGLGLEE